ncbi:MAG: tetratricopeptide repeat protein [Pseudomonadota bacterium]
MTAIELITLLGTAAGTGGVFVAYRALSAHGLPEWLPEPLRVTTRALRSAAPDARDKPAAAAAPVVGDMLDPRLTHSAQGADQRGPLLARIRREFDGVGRKLGVALAGSPGAGQFEVALAFAQAEVASGRYHGAWLIDSSSMLTAAADLQRLANRLEITTQGPAADVVKSVQKAILTTRERWLLVHECVDSEHASVELPKRLFHAGRIDHLVCGYAASRQPRLARIEVPPPSADIAASLLQGDGDKTAKDAAAALAVLLAPGGAPSLAVGRAALSAPGNAGAGLSAQDYVARLRRHHQGGEDTGPAQLLTAAVAEAAGRLPADGQTLTALLAALPYQWIELPVTSGGAASDKAAGQTLTALMRDAERVAKAQTACRAVGLLSAPTQASAAQSAIPDRADPFLIAALRYQLTPDRLEAGARHALSEIRALLSRSEEPLSFARASDAARRAIALAELGPSLDPTLARTVAAVLGEVGKAAMPSGDSLLVNLLQRHRMALVEAVDGADSTEYAAVLLDLATSASAIGRWEEAETCFARALATQKEADPRETATLAEFYRHLGFFCWHRRRYEEADNHLQEALRILRRTAKGKSPVIGACYGDLAALYSDWSRSGLDGAPTYKALAYHRKSLDLVIEGHGPCHREVALRLHNLAQETAAAGEPERALDHQLRAAAIARLLLSTGKIALDDPDIARFSGPLPRMLDAAGRPNEIPKLPGLVAEQVAQIQQEHAAWRSGTSR